MLSTGLTQKSVDVRLIWTDYDETGDYVVPNVLSSRDLVSRPENMDETVLHTYVLEKNQTAFMNWASSTSLLA